jgi:hypothetical protein
MGLFDKLFGKKSDGESYDRFSLWLDKHLSQDLSGEIIALNFNLYEGSEQTYDIELVGCASFDEDNGDWASDEVFATRDDLFFIPRTADIAQWEQGLSFVTSLVEKYLSDGKYNEKLKSYTAVGIGFVDGDIDIICRSK